MRATKVASPSNPVKHKKNYLKLKNCNCPPPKIIEIIFHVHFRGWTCYHCQIVSTLKQLMSSWRLNFGFPGKSSYHHPKFQSQNHLPNRNMFHGKTMENNLFRWIFRWFCWLIFPCQVAGRLHDSQRGSCQFSNQPIPFKSTLCPHQISHDIPSVYALSGLASVCLTLW